jgi:hypothetical protein
VSSRVHLDPKELGPLIEAGLYRPSPEQIAEAMLARAELLRLLDDSPEGIRRAGRSLSPAASVLRGR